MKRPLATALATALTAASLICSATPATATNSYLPDGSVVVPVRDGTPFTHRAVPAEKVSDGVMHGGSSRTDESSAIALRTLDDVKPGSPHHRQIQWMLDREITSGYADGTFKAGRQITRGEVAAFLHRHADAEAPSAGNTFSDVPAGSPNYAAISWLAQSGATSGYADGSFRPGQNITRGEFSAFLYRMADPDSTAPKASPFRDMAPASANYAATTWLASNGIVDGYANGAFLPGRAVARGEVAKMLYGYAVKTEPRPLIDYGAGPLVWSESDAAAKGLPWTSGGLVLSDGHAGAFRDPYGPSPIAEGQSVNALPGVTVEPGEPRLVWHGLDPDSERDRAMARTVSSVLLGHGFTDLEIYWGDGWGGVAEWDPATPERYDGMAQIETDMIWLRGHESWDLERAVQVAIHEALHQHQVRLVDRSGKAAGWNELFRSMRQVTGDHEDPHHRLLDCAQARIPGPKVNAPSQCTADPAWAEATTAVMEGRLP